MQLHHLFCDIISNAHLPATEVLGLASNSNKIKPGYLFVAISNEAQRFIPNAIDRGAVAILSAADHDTSDNVIYLKHHDPKKIYHRLAKRFYPQQPERVVAVTGTNGKTSVVSFYQQLLAQINIKAAFIGTLGVNGAEQKYSINLTTPDAADMHHILHDLSSQGIQDVAIEASSHGLEQERVHSVDVAAAAFTNLSHDHFDYHDSYTSYLADKAKLFSEVLALDGVAVLNADINEFQHLQDVAKTKNIITYGKNAHDIILLAQRPHEHGQTIIFRANNCRKEIDLPILGQFQSYNILCALGLMMAVGYDIPDVENLQPVAGRMQLVQKNGYRIVIDYAHTPDALRSALLSLRWHMQSGKLILVFGCGGDRDKTKRYSMGVIAQDHADLTIVCDDNPRNENPAKIRRDIMIGCQKAIEIGDRKKAIAHAIERASREDVILIAGKGHEDKQVYADVIISFNDLITVNSIMQNE